MGFDKVCVIAHDGKPLTCLKSLLAVLSELFSKIKPNTLPKVNSITHKSRIWTSFSDKAAEFMEINEGAGPNLD
tara:strand:- start:39 stop:260 length:222 start_codon:yes stop_codon:yes gene_type:complete